MEYLVARHESLRTNFLSEDGIARQVIRGPEGWSVNYRDYSEQDYTQALAAACEDAYQESLRPFDLSHDWLFRVAVTQLSATESFVFVNMHHIISDGWSIYVLIKEFIGVYDSLSKGLTPNIPALQVQYADYAAWQRQYLTGETLDRQSKYWKEKLTGVDALELPTDRKRPKSQTFNGAAVNFEVGEEIKRQLMGLSKENDATAFMTLHSVFKVLLYRHSGQDDICVGVPIANRTRTETEGLIGFFVNTLALRCDMGGNPKFKQLLEQVKKTTLEAYAHQDLPFEKVVDLVQPQRDPSRSPLFQVMFVLQNTPSAEKILPELSIKMEELECEISKFDLTLMLDEGNENGFYGKLEYNTDLYDRSTIERMVGNFLILLKEVLTNPDRTLDEYDLITEKERKQLIYDWNNTVLEYDREKTILDVFEEQVKKTSDKTALVFEGQTLSYGQLNERANRVAHYLRARGIEADSLVAIYAQRSLEMIVGVLGILKAGGAYIPLDPSYPAERLSYMVEDSGAKVVLSIEMEDISFKLPSETVLL